VVNQSKESSVPAMWIPKTRAVDGSKYVHILVTAEEKAQGNTPAKPQEAVMFGSVTATARQGLAGKIGLVLCQEEPTLRSRHGP